MECEKCEIRETCPHLQNAQAIVERVKNIIAEITTELPRVPGVVVSLTVDIDYCTKYGGNTGAIVH